MNANNQNSDPAEARLRRLLKEAALAPELPLGFQKAVWRRIETRAVESPEKLVSSALGILGWLLRPRVAMASLGAVLLSGVILGAAHGMAAHKEQARDRYLAAVAPMEIVP